MFTHPLFSSGVSLPGQQATRYTKGVDTWFSATSANSIGRDTFTDLTLVMSLYIETNDNLGTGHAILDGSSGAALAYGGGTSSTSFNYIEDTFTRTLTGTSCPKNQWIGVMIAVDDGVQKLYLNGSQEATQSHADGWWYGSGALSGTGYFGRGGGAGINKPTFRLGMLWSTETYLDPATEWSKFFDGSNKPINLGDDGSIPTGTQPLHFFKDGDPSVNSGSLGNYTENGSVERVAGPNA